LGDVTIADQKNRKTKTTEALNDALLMEREMVWMELVAIPEEEEEVDYGVVVIPTEQLQLYIISYIFLLNHVIKTVISALQHPFKLGVR